MDGPLASLPTAPDLTPFSYLLLIKKLPDVDVVAGGWPPQLRVALERVQRRGLRGRKSEEGKRTRGHASAPM